MTTYTQQALQVFDSWAGELSPAHFRRFALPCLARIATMVKQRLHEHNLPLVPMVVFAKGAHYAITDLLATEYDVIGLDWTMEPHLVKRQAVEYMNAHPNGRKRVAFQGNLDPTLLYAPAEVIQREAEAMVRAFLLRPDGKGLDDPRLGYICNLGHGIQPEVPVESVQVFLETVERVSRQVLGGKTQ